jgi:hypothetical protein
VPSEAQSNNIVCSILSKPLCDKYSLIDTYIRNVDVVDAPCLFNGADDSVDTLCVSQSSLESGNCTVIKSNGLVAYDEEERKLCDEAPVFLGWSFTCSWVESSYGSDYGSCSTVYHLGGSGL